MSETQSALHDLFEGRRCREITMENAELLRSASRRDTTARRQLPIDERAYGSTHGELYTARSYARTIKASRAVAIYLALNEEPIEFLVSGKHRKSQAVIFKPLVSRTVMDCGLGLVCVTLSPAHPQYRHFSITSADKTITLERKALAPLDHAIRDAFLGTLDLHGGLQLMEQIVSIAARNLPAPKPLDPRVAAILKLLHADANRSVDDLASAVGLSYFRLSHLFSNSLGLSLRSYQLWLKIDRAWRLVEQGRSLVEIAALSGFNGTAHLCHAFQDTYGVPLVQLLRNVRVKMSFNRS